MRHWRLAVRGAKRVQLPHVLPRFNVLRNYEFESLLNRVFDGEWVVSEWCPFNGIWCKWIEHAPQSELDAKIKWYEVHRAELTSIDVDAHLSRLRTASTPKVLGGANSCFDL